MSARQTPQTIDLDAMAEGVRRGERAVLARAITLVESARADHQEVAQTLLQTLLPDRPSDTHRIGITGVPGVGKSTTIDQFASNLTRDGHRVAVLAVDPTSARSGGSILGDKTRMAKLAGDRNAFIRPSPTSGTLGGVTKKTRETMALCEAAGFDVVIVETVGVGQSEIAVADMVDVFLFLALPGAGDELQGIKKGILEIADIIAVNKSDGENVSRATHAAAEYRSALHILTPPTAIWRPTVHAISGLTNTGLEALWQDVQAHRKTLENEDAFTPRRRSQDVRWMREMVEERLRAHWQGNSAVAARLPEIEANVRDGKLTPSIGADTVVRLMTQTA
ncbi:MAG: methylmalonyl Co-A mutase-associated GTPase MeaB [Pseudomonadota bacterium]